MVSGIFFGIERHKERYFSKGVCLVINSTVIRVDCGYDDIDICYYPVWLVKYNNNATAHYAEIGEPISAGSYENAVSDLNRYPVS
jgi:hypothetical protein